MNKKELFTIQPFESLLDLETPLVIEERPNSGQDALKQDFNLLHNNVYIDFKDYQTFVRDGIPETKITNRGSVFNQNYFQLLPKFPDITGNPYLELFSNDSGEFLNVYQEQSFKDHSTFLNGVSVDNEQGINIVENTVDGLRQTKLKMEYDEAFEENVLSFLTFPEPQEPQEQVDFYQNLKVKDLFILGTTYFTNVEDLFVQDAIVDINKLQDGTVPQEEITGFKFNEPSEKYGKFVLDPNYNGDDVQQFVLTEYGYQTAGVENFQDLYLNGIYQVGLLNTPLVETDEISSLNDGLVFDFNTTQNFENELIVNKQNTKVEVTNLLESQEIKQNHVYTDQTTQFNSEQEQYYFDSQLNNFVIDKFTFLDNKLLVDDTSLDIQNSLEQDIILNLTGDLNVSSDTTLNNLNVTNNLNLQTGTGQTLTVDGFSTFNNGQEINNGLTVYGGQTFNSQVISGEFIQGQPTTFSNILGNVTIGSVTKSLQVLSIQEFNDQVTIDGTLTQTSDVQLNSDSVSIGNQDQVVDINGDVSLSQVQKNTHVLGDLYVDGSQTFNNGFSIGNQISQSNYISTNNEQTNTIIGDLNLSQTGKETTIFGDFIVEEVQTFKDSTTFQSNIFIDGNQRIGQDETYITTINGTVNISNFGKNSTIKGNLDVNGETNLYNQVNIYNNDFGIYNHLSNLKFNVSGTRIDNNINTYVNENLYLMKNIIHNNSLSNHEINGNLTLSSVGKNLNVLGNSEFDGSVIFNSPIDVNGMTVSGDQTFNGQIAYNDEIDFNNMVNFYNTITVPQDTTVNIGFIQIYYDTATSTLIVE